MLNLADVESNQNWHKTFREHSLSPSSLFHFISSFLSTLTKAVCFNDPFSYHNILDFPLV